LGSLSQNQLAASLKQLKDVSAIYFRYPVFKVQVFFAAALPESLQKRRNIEVFWWSQAGSNR
ncbi:hypothetical protein RB620_30185, partial [Paenibacillus sp. LHD-117]|uniref:hypothetical protein n=1 Tax=Paenibacillus sp. LHD-117 TaxID=3071412 RepID=UPI0027E02BAE